MFILNKGGLEHYIFVMDKYDDGKFFPNSNSVRNA